jgi:hypothetical protein
MPYRSLNADHIEATIERLTRRIEERFPGRGLGKLCGELLHVAREDRNRMAWRAKPNLWIRGIVAVMLALGVAGVVYALVRLSGVRVDVEALNVLSAAEAVFNIVALFGAVIWFLLNLETVWRREAVLKDLHELRSIAHVVDMHQLTKDPTTILKSYSPTASSDPHGMTHPQLVRYLDYCSEMLALTGKLAALYMQNVRDPVIIQAVNEIEDLTTSLSRKIWQKIMLINDIAEHGQFRE